MHVSIIFKLSNEGTRLEVKDSMGRTALVQYPDRTHPEAKASLQWFIDRIDAREPIAEGSEWRNGYTQWGLWAEMRASFSV